MLDVPVGVSPVPAIAITPTLLEIMQVFVGQRLTLEMITKIQRRDWLLVQGEVLSLTYGPGPEMLKVWLRATNGEQTILAVVAPDSNADFPNFRDDPDLPRWVPVQNLEPFQSQLEAAATIQGQAVSCIYDQTTRTLESLILHAPAAPGTSTTATGAAPAGAATTASTGATPADELPPPLQIELRYTGQITASQRAIFELAAQRWGEVLRSPWPPLSVDGNLVNGVIIDVATGTFDGPSGIFGVSGPTQVRPDSGLPTRGQIALDIADLEQREADGSLANVVLHEMGHVLGFGSLWERFELVQQLDTDNPVYVGEAGMREYAQLLGTEDAEPVPLENRGGELTQEGHWRESVLGNELMTGFLSGGLQPLSRLTVATFADLGYLVNYEAADGFALPTQGELELMGIPINGSDGRRCRQYQQLLQRAQIVN